MMGSSPAAATDGKGRIWFVGGQEHVPRRIYADVEVLSGNNLSDSTPIRTAIQGAAAVWTHDTGTCVFGGSTVPQTEPIEPAMLVATIQCLEGTEPGWPRSAVGSPKTLARRSSIAPSTSSDRDLAHRAWLVPGSEPDIVLALRFG